MEPVDAVLTVLAEEGVPLHWTVIQDLALRRGYLDPFSTPDIRKRLLAGLAEARRAGSVERIGPGVFSLPEEAAP